MPRYAVGSLSGGREVFEPRACIHFCERNQNPRFPLKIVRLFASNHGAMGHRPYIDPKKWVSQSNA